jgi:hypothetical protein
MSDSLYSDLTTNQALPILNLGKSDLIRSEAKSFLSTITNNLKLDPIVNNKI